MTVVEHGKDSDPRLSRPAFARPKLIGLVLLGGAVGTAGREGLALAFPPGESRYSVLIVNIVGAFLLGMLLTALAASGPETPLRRDIRLFSGTGVMGGFTTYSSLATDSAQLIEKDPLWGILFAAGCVLAGLAAAAFGVWLAGRMIPAKAKQ